MSYYANILNTALCLQIKPTVLYYDILSIENIPFLANIDASLAGERPLPLHLGRSGAEGNPSGKR